MSGLARRLDALPAAGSRSAWWRSSSPCWSPMALARGHRRDEGYYTLAASLVADGKLPYRGLLLPADAAAAVRLRALDERVRRDAGSGRARCRWSAPPRSASCSTGTRRPAGARRRSACLAVALYVTSMLVLLWMTVVKTYPLSTLLLFGGLRGRRPPRPAAEPRAAGSRPACCSGWRSTPGCCSPPPRRCFLVYALRSGRRRGGAPALALGTLAGIASGCSRALVLFALDPRRFWFHNLGYHSVRSPGGLFGSLGDKLDVVWELLMRQPAVRAARRR